MNTGLPVISVQTRMRRFSFLIFISFTILLNSVVRIEQHVYGFSSHQQRRWKTMNHFQQHNHDLEHLLSSTKDYPSVTTNISQDESLDRISSAHSTPRVYISHILQTNPKARSHILNLLETNAGDDSCSKREAMLWEQVKLEAQVALDDEPAAGPQLYTLILSQSSLIRALINIISLEVQTELMPATAIQSLFLQMLDPIEDGWNIQLDIIAAATRLSSSHSTDALTAILFDEGLHALVCHRVSHRLWKAKRTGLAYYMQSTVSRVYCADLHPAARFGSGVYLNAGGGVVIGETAVVGDDVTILQGVTLGGTGKERGDRHPKVGRGVILNVGAIVLGNIPIGDFSIISAKSLVNKPVERMAIVSGIPAKVKGYRTMDDLMEDMKENGEELESCNTKTFTETMKDIIDRIEQTYTI